MEVASVGVAFVAVHYVFITVFFFPKYLQGNEYTPLYKRMSVS